MEARYRTRADLEGEAFGRLAGTAAAGVWVAGSLEGLAGPAVAIVGTRAPSDLGRRLAHRLAFDLGRAGACVVSGLALGIDGAAHAGALEAGAPTVAVLGGGHRQLFPARHAGLAARIVAAGGAIVSPYPPDTPARPWQFLHRNGLVAALADALVVVEAAARSGALNTASWAADRGIPVMAVPGDVDRPRVAGCLALLRDGAILVRNAADVLAALGLGALPPAAHAGPSARPGGIAGRLLAAVEAEPAPVDVLIARCGAVPAAALAALGELVAAGAIVEGHDGCFRRSGG